MISKFVIALGSFVLAPMVHAEEMTIVSYNIKHGQGKDGTINLTRQAKVLSHLDADVIALQEVDFFTRRSDYYNQAEIIAAMLSEKTGSHWRHIEAPAIPYKGGMFGNGLLFNDDVLDLIDHEVVALPGSPEGDGARSAALAHLRHDEGWEVLIAATHLTHKHAASSDGATLQIASIEKLAEAMEGSIPAMIAGDFNASVDVEDDRNLDTMNALESMGWRVDSPVEGSTIPDGDPIVIDYIASKNTESWDVIDTRIVNGKRASKASDHLPVVVTYKVAD